MTSSDSNYLSKTPTPNTITLGIRALIYEFWGTHSVHSRQIDSLIRKRPFPTSVQWKGQVLPLSTSSFILIKSN